MMTRSIWIFSLLLGATLVVGAADDKKQPPAPIPPAVAEILKLTPEEFIKRFDKNGDGFLSKEELPPRFVQAFEKLDANGDGKLDAEEVAVLLNHLRKRFNVEHPAAPAKKGPSEIDRQVTRWLEEMDRNKDGKISKEEARGPLALGFARFDQNQDGYLDRQELRPAAAIFIARQRDLVSGPDFDALDADADGRLSREELKGTPYHDAFEAIDTNKDGTIDRKEFQAYLKKQAEKKKP